MPAGMKRYEFDGVTVEPGTFRVQRSGRSLALEPKATHLLIYLIEHRSRVIGKEELLHQVWADAAVTDNAITRVVAQLRKALGDNARVARYIETIPTLGYRFISEVTEIDAGPEPQAAPVPPSPFFWNRTGARLLAAAVLSLTVVGAWIWRVWGSHAAVAWSGSPLGAGVNASYPRIAPDGQLLAFRAIVDGEWQLAVMKPDTANWTVITHDRQHGSVASLAWARNGSRIYFERRFGAGSIYAVSPLGGEPQLLLANAMGPEPLPDGSMVVLRQSHGRQQLLRYWPDSGRLESLPAWTTSYRCVRAFPDGKEVAVLGFVGSPDGARRLFAMDLASREARDLMPPEQAAGESGGPENVIALSADGQTVFAVYRRDDSMMLIGLPRGGSQRPLTWFSYPPGANLLPCDGAPDGSIYMEQATRQSSVLNIGPAGNAVSETPLPWGTRLLPVPGGGVVFTLRRGGKHQLLTVTNGTEPRPLLNTAESVRLPGAWIGKGRVVFLAGERDQARLAIASVESGRILQRFQADARNVTAIAADPGGSRIFYTAAGVLWAQPVAGGEPHKMGDANDVAADPSGRFLYLTRHGTEGDEFFRMPAVGGDARKLALPNGYTLAPNPLSPAAVNSDGRILLPVQTKHDTFFQVAIYDPDRQNLRIVPSPYQTIVNGAGWGDGGSIEMQVTHWSSALWRYRRAPRNPARP